jgi:hypothetical protein
MTTKTKSTPIAVDPVEQVSDVTTSDGKNAAAVALGRKGGAVVNSRKSASSRKNVKIALKARIKNARARRKAAEKAEREAAQA